MSFNDFAVQLYLTILAIAAAPIVLSWCLRRIAGDAHRPAPIAQESTEEIAWRNEVHHQEEEDADIDWWRYWSGRSDYT